LQVLGGYGFCTDFPLEQYYRDIRITALYEGTTGIQSLDLLGRKVVMNNGSAMKHLTQEIISTIKEASTFDELKPYADQLKMASKELASITQFLLKYAMSGEHERYIADASIYMELMSNVVIAWQWLKMAAVAKTALVSGKTVLGSTFYERKIHTMRFYFKYELPKIMSAKMTLMNEEILTIPEDNKVAFS
jgi:butyryl-CoA dehydrogenase